MTQTNTAILLFVLVGIFFVLVISGIAKIRRLNKRLEQMTESCPRQERVDFPSVTNETPVQDVQKNDGASIVKKRLTEKDFDEIRRRIGRV